MLDMSKSKGEVELGSPGSSKTPKTGRSGVGSRKIKVIKLSSVRWYLQNINCEYILSFLKDFQTDIFR